jgi:hypothetical protein
MTKDYPDNNNNEFNSSSAVLFRSTNSQNNLGDSLLYNRKSDFKTYDETLSSSTSYNKKTNKTANFEDFQPKSSLSTKSRSKYQNKKIVQL